MSVAVDESWSSSGSVTASSSGAMRTASSLPSSTPHWSKRVDAPDHALDEHPVLVERDDPAERGRVEASEDERGRRAVAGEDLVRGDGAAVLDRRQRLARAVRPFISASDWARQLASSRSWWCSSAGSWPVGADQELAAGRRGALVDQLVEGVLAVGAGLAPDDRAGGAGDGRAVERRPACRSIPCRAAAGRPAAGSSRWS